MQLEAAVGWIQLGDYDSANDELEKIRAEWRAHPDVLELRWLIYSNDEQWDACLDIVSAIVKMAPDRAQGWLDKAFSLRRANDGGVEKAKTVLLEAALTYDGVTVVFLSGLQDILHKPFCHCRQGLNKSLWHKEDLNYLPFRRHQAFRHHRYHLGPGPYQYS